MLSVPEAASKARRNPETIRRWIRSKKLRARRVGIQHWIDERDLVALLIESSRALPKAWKRTLTGEPMPDVVRAIRRSRRGH